jgi:hypothetical protein
MSSTPGTSIPGFQEAPAYGSHPESRLWQSDLPAYTVNPPRNEIRLGYTVPVGVASLALPSNTYTKPGKKMVVRLGHQYKEAAYPTYGLDADIVGSLTLEDPAEVLHVELRVCHQSYHVLFCLITL